PGRRRAGAPPPPPSADEARVRSLRPLAHRADARPSRDRSLGARLCCVMHSTLGGQVVERVVVRVAEMVDLEISRLWTANSVDHDGAVTVPVKHLLPDALPPLGEGGGSPFGGAGGPGLVAAPDHQAPLVFFLP